MTLKQLDILIEGKPGITTVALPPDLAQSMLSRLAFGCPQIATLDLTHRGNEITRNVLVLLLNVFCNVNTVALCGSVYDNNLEKCAGSVRLQYLKPKRKRPVDEPKSAIEKCWKRLCAEKEAVEKMGALGVETADDLRELEHEDVVELGNTLKKVQKSKLMKALAGN